MIKVYPDGLEEDRLWCWTTSCSISLGDKIEYLRSPRPNWTNLTHCRRSAPPFESCAPRCGSPHSMPICIECRYPVSQLYHVLHSSSKTKKPPSTAAPSQGSTPAIPSATTKSRSDGLARVTTGGVGDVRLTQCPRCKRFADKYVEHDFVVLFIDLVLVKPQVGLLGVVKVFLAQS